MKAVGSPVGRVLQQATTVRRGRQSISVLGNKQFKKQEDYFEEKILDPPILRILGVAEIGTHS